MEDSVEPAGRDREEGELCLSCRLPFDSGKKRKLTDTCGHARCYSCMFQWERCPGCEVAADNTRSPQKSLTQLPKFFRPILPPNVSPETVIATSITTTTTMEETASRKPFGDPHPTDTKTDTATVDVRHSDNINMYSNQHDDDDGDDEGDDSYEDIAGQTRNTARLGGGQHHGAALGLDQDCLRLPSPHIFHRNTSKSPDSPGDYQVSANSLRNHHPLPGAPPPSPADMGLRHHPTVLSLPGTTRNDGVALGGLSSSSSSLSSSIECSTPDTELSSDTSRKSSVTASSVSEMCLVGRIPRRWEPGLFPLETLDPSQDCVTPSTAKEDAIPLRSAQPHHQQQSLQPALQPLVFEVPHPEARPVFIGRHWVFQTMDTVVNGKRSDSRQLGVVILGGVGSGKTAIVEQLVAHSCFRHTLRHPPIADTSHLDSNSLQTAVAHTPSRPLSYPVTGRTVSHTGAVGHTQRPSRQSMPPPKAETPGHDCVRTGHLISSRPPPPPPSSSYHTGQVPKALSLKKASDCSLTGDHLTTMSQTGVSGVRDEGGHTACPALQRLGRQVVAYHLCQADNSVTCLVPDFVYSLAACLCQSPRMRAYRYLLAKDRELQHLLTWQQCVEDPSAAFVKGVLDPLRTLQKNGHILKQNCLIIVDAVNEAELHRPDLGLTVGAFIVQHTCRFPCWLKLVVTCRTALQSTIRPLPCHYIVLDKTITTIPTTTSTTATSTVADSHSGVMDMQEYINYRLQCSPTLRLNAAVHDKSDSAAEKKFCSRMQSLSKGCFLYARMVLDLLEGGQLVVKSTSYKVLPISLSEVFLLHFNIHFSSVRAFERVLAILAVCLAAVQPLSFDAIFLAVNSGYVAHYVTWEEFGRRMALLSPFLFRRQDGSYTFFHPAFREWLIVRDNHDTAKFLCNLRLGHGLIALHLSRSGESLTAEQTLELGHHVLKAHIYKYISGQRAVSSRHLQAFWVCFSSPSLSQALVNPRNVFCPNVKVSRLILSAGGDPNVRTEVSHNAPLLCIVSREGFADMATLLLEFGADINAGNDVGMTPLSYAASSGQVEVMRILCQHNARPSVQDKEGQCAAVHAALCDQLGSLAFLLQLKWRPHQGEPDRQQAVLQCLAVAAATGNIQVVQYLHRVTGEDALNVVDTLLGETALTASCIYGQLEVVRYLLEEGADIALANSRTLPPLLCAVKAGHWDSARLVLQAGAHIEQTDKHGRTALMLAASYGHLRVLDLLLCKGAQLESTDREGLTALCWASLRGHITLVQSLFYRGAHVQHCDVNGRTPLHLAASCGNAQVVQFLMNKGAAIDHVDMHGMRPIDRAVGSGHTGIIGCFLNRGARLEAETWSMAAGNMETVLLLLEKQVLDGNTLFKKGKVQEAEHLYVTALGQVDRECQEDSHKDSLHQVKISLLLKLSHCKRKQNDYPAAIDLATRVLDLNPQCLGAYYARARAQRDYQQYGSAQADLKEALQLAPDSRQVLQLLARIKQECTQHIFSQGLLPTQPHDDEDNDASSQASDMS